jgi:hypothetical protein
MTIASFTRARCPELADFLEACAVAPLAFEGAHAMSHSAANHIHLWALEYWADHHAWIDLDYRAGFAEVIVERWRGRLKGLPPYRRQGYRIYLYEDMAPTLSAVAETGEGCPYGGNLHFVASPREVMAAYVGQSWRARFSGEPWPIAPARILAAVEHAAGSIGQPTASALGLGVGELRALIERIGLGQQVNAIRKRYRRRAAAFKPGPESDRPILIHELRLAAGYR